MNPSPRRSRIASRIRVSWVAAFIILCASAARGEVIFDAIFDGEPLGPLATQPNTDPLPLHLPTNIIRDGKATVDVVRAAGDLARKPLLLRSNADELASAALHNPTQVSSGKAHISWDSLVTAIPGLAVNAPFSDVSIVEERGGGLWEVLRIVYRNLGTATEPKLTLTVVDARGMRDVAKFQVGVHDHFELRLDLDAASYELDIRWKGEVGGKLMGNGDFRHVYFRSMSRGTKETAPPLAFDNLLVEVFPRGGCSPIDVEDLRTDTEFPCGSAFVTNGVLLRVREFFWGPGGCVNPTANGRAIVMEQGVACRKGNELWLGNVNVGFDYGGPIGGIKIHYGEWGGTSTSS